VIEHCNLAALGPQRRLKPGRNGLFRRKAVSRRQAVAQHGYLDDGARGVGCGLRMSGAKTPKDDQH